MLKSGINKTIRKFHKKNNNKKRSIVLNTNGKYLFACGTLIINIIDKIENFDNIIVYYSDVPQEHIESLKKIDKRILCEKVTLDSLNKEFYENEKIIDDSTFVKRYTHLPFAKIKMFRLLEEYSQAIFLDLDMLVLDSLDDLLNDKHSNIIWRNDNQTIFDKISRHSKQNDKIKELELYKKITTPNGGLIILNRNFDFNEAFKIGKEFIKTSLAYHPFLIDELTFGYIAYKLNLKVNNVNGMFYNTFPNYLTSESKLPHFLGNFKPWLSETIQLIFPQWGKFYKKYCELTDNTNDNVKIYKNTYQLIYENKYYNTWLPLLSSYTFPKLLKVNLDINKQFLEITYNISLKYYIKSHSLFNNFNIYFDIDKKTTNNISEIIAQINILLDRYKNLKFENLPEYLRLSSGDCPFHEITRKFSLFYKQTFVIRTICENTDISNFKQISLKSYFNKYLYLNGLTLKQTDDEKIAHTLQIYLNSNKLFIKLSDDDTLIKSINKNGIVTLSEKIYCFYCIVENNELSININNNYLSARDDGSISLMPHGREWEKFSFKYI